MTQIRSSLDRRTLLAFALPAILQGFMHAPAQSLIQGIYAKHLGLPLAALGTAVLITRIFDAAIDPLLGVAADLWRERTGSYKALIGCGTLVTVLGLWFLYQPGHDAGIGYFVSWFMVAYLGWTLTEIPYKAWSMELSSDYVLRTRIQTWLAVATILGSSAFFIVPHVTKVLGTTHTAEINLGTLSTAALCIALTMPLANLATLLIVPDGPAHNRGARPGVRQIWNAVAGNGPMIYFVLTFLVAAITTGMNQGIMFLFVDSYLKLGEHFASILLLGTPAVLIGIPLWGAVCRRMERQKVWAVCLGLTGLCFAALGFIEPGKASLVPFTTLLTLLMVFLTCSFVAAPAMVGDVIDYGRWKFDRDHGGLYVAFYTSVLKSATGLGIALSFIVLDWLGYDSSRAMQTDQGAFAMKAAAAWIPSVGVLLAASLLWFFPITRARHAHMLQEIEARAHRAPQELRTRREPEGTIHHAPQTDVGSRA